METVTISKEENLKKEAEVDWDLVNKIRRSLEDIKHGRVEEWD